MGKWKYRIQDRPRYRILDPGNRGSRMFLVSLHMPASILHHFIPFSGLPRLRRSLAVETAPADQRYLPCFILSSLAMPMLLRNSCIRARRLQNLEKYIKWIKGNYNTIQFRKWRFDRAFVSKRLNAAMGYNTKYGSNFNSKLAEGKSFLYKHRLLWCLTSNSGC